LTQAPIIKPFNAEEQKSKLLE